MRLILLLCAAIWAGSLAAAAETYRLGSIEVSGPWARATPKGATIAGGYMQIRNHGTVPDRLLGGSSEAAKRFEIHSTTLDQGVMRMRELKDGLTIEPGKTAELKPGSYHLMLVELGRALKQGDRVKATLVFEKAGRLEVEFAVEAIGAQPSSARQHGGGH